MRLEFGLKDVDFTSDWSHELMDSPLNILTIRTYNLTGSIGNWLI